MKKDYKTISRSTGKLRRPALAAGSTSATRRTRTKKRARVGASGGDELRLLLDSAARFAFPIAAATFAILLFVTVVRYVRDVNFFAIRHLVISGNAQVAGDEISSAVLNGKPTIFDVRLGRARDRLLDNPWIERANIRKIYPDMLAVEIVERKPVGIMNSEGNLYYMDAAGERFKQISVEDDLGLPLITVARDDDIRGYPMEVVNWLLAYFAWNPVLSHEKISQIGYSSATGFKIFLASHAEIRLGSDGFKEKLENLVKTMTSLSGQRVQLRFADLNVKGSVVVKVAKK